MERCEVDLFDYLTQSYEEGALCRALDALEEEGQSSEELQACPASGEGTWLKFVRRLFRQLVSATRYCHEMGVAHLDMSLENVMLSLTAGDRRETAGAHCKVIDFGLARYYPAGGFVARGAVGKLTYMAPEVVADRKRFDARSADIWSLGVMLFMLMVGDTPFHQGAVSARKKKKKKTKKKRKGKGKEQKDRRGGVDKGSTATSFLSSLLLLQSSAEEEGEGDEDKEEEDEEGGGSGGGGGGGGGTSEMVVDEEGRNDFDRIMAGGLEEELRSLGLLPLVSEDALDLLKRIFRPQSERITMAGIVRHPWVQVNDHI